MVPVNVVAVASTLAMLLWCYRRDIPAHHDASALSDPASAIRDRPTFLAGFVVLGALLVAFFSLELVGIPISVIASLGMYLVV